MPETQIPLIRTEIWDGFATNYEAFIEPITSFFGRAALDLAGPIGENSRVIEIAAGTGALSVAIADKGAHLLATDFSPKMVERVQARLEEFGTKAEARLMNGQALSVPDASFDLAISVFGVMLFADWRKGLSELARVTCPGGKGCMVVWSQPEGANIFVTINQAYRSAFPDAPKPLLPEGMVYLHKPDQLAGAMAQVGFDDVAVHIVETAWKAPSADWIFENSEQLFGNLSFFTDLEPDQRIFLFEHYKKILAEYETETGIVIPTFANVAVGTR